MNGRFARDLLIGVATFMLVGAGTVHLLVPPVLVAQWPLETVRTRAVAEAATVLDPVTLRTDVDAMLVQVRVVSPAPVGEGDDVAYTVSSSTRNADGTVVLRERWTGVQGAPDGAVVPSPLDSELRTVTTSSGDALERSSPLPDMAGQLLRFPPGDQDRSWRRWDPATRTSSAAVRAAAGPQVPDGVVVVRQRVPATPVESGSSTTVASDTELWVRPLLGAVVRTRSHVVVRTGEVVLLDATFVDDDASVAAATSAVRTRESLVRVWTLLVPGALLVAGLLALLGAVTIAQRDVAPQDTARAASRDPTDW